MAELATIPTLLAVLASYLLVLWASRGRRPTLAEFLFSGNTVALSISSGVGSLFTVSIACTALLSAGFLYGWQILLSSIAGTAAGTLILLRLIKSPTVEAFKARQLAEGPVGGSSFLAMLASRARATYPVGTVVILILVYTTLLASELAVFRVTTASLVSLDTPELLAILLMIVGICFSYVFVGGYRATLLTDHFQMMIVAAFFGMLFGQIDWSDIDLQTLSGPAHSALSIVTWFDFTILHAASFLGSACLVVGSADHWFRTIGTLTLPEARRSLIVCSVIGSVAGSLVVLAGTYYARLSSQLTPVAGQGSLRLLENIASLGSRSLTFMLFAALACVALTTINTYMITQQQLYYEFVTRYSARSAGSYLVEYFVRWRQVRLVGFVLVATAFLISLSIPSDWIYGVGVAALSTAIAFSPLLVTEAFGRRQEAVQTWTTRSPTLAVLLSYGLWLPAIVALEHISGSAWSRLYLIPCGLTISTAIGYLVAGIWRGPGRATEGEAV
jgi:hypothetical protein